MAFAGYLKQSTAVDILIGPFVDDTDGTTAETGLTLDVEVSKNGQALVNKSDATVPSHDAAGTVDGYYNCELDATDTGTLGILTIVAHAAGFLPVRLDYQIVVAHWYDTMCSTDYLQVDVIQVEGSDATDQIRDAVVDDATRLDASSLNAIEAKVDTVDTNVDAILVDTGTTLDAALAVVDSNVDSILADTNELQTDDVPGLIGALNDLSTADVNAQCDAAIETYHLDHLLAADYDPASKPGVATALLNELVENDGGVSRFTENALEQAPSGTGASAATIADAVWDEAAADHVAAGSFGAQAGTDIDAILADTNELQTDDIPGSLTTIESKIDTVDTNVDAILVDTGTTLDAALAVVDGNVDSILTDTGTDGVVLANDAITAAKIAANAIGASEIADNAIDAGAIATDAIAADEIAAAAANKIADHIIRRTFQNACDSANGDAKTGRSLLGAIAKQVNKVSISGSTLTITEDDDATSLYTQSITVDSGADPIIGLDTS